MTHEDLEKLVDSQARQLGTYEGRIERLERAVMILTAELRELREDS